MKWAVIGQNVISSRFEAAQKLLEEAGVANSLEIIESNLGSFPADLEKAMASFETLRIDSPFGIPVVEMGRGKTMLVEAFRAADTVICKDGQWWLNASLFYGFNSAFSAEGERLDLGSEVLVVGAGAAARLATAAAVRAGFQAVAITCRSQEKGQQLITLLGRKYFGVNFRYIPQEQLILLPGTCGLVINATPFASDNDLLVELDYLNFLRPDGMIWDLVLQPATTPLLRAGEQFGVRALHGYELAAFSDAAWLSWIAPQAVHKINFTDAYREVFTNTDKKSDLGLVTKNGTAR